MFRPALRPATSCSHHQRSRRLSVWWAVVVMVLLAEGCCHARADDEDVLSWWNIGKFLREFVNTGLGAKKLQEHVSTGYTWRNEEVDGHQRLKEINLRASKLFQKNIKMGKGLKKVIEQEYDNWERVYPQQVNASSLCCSPELSSSGCGLWSTHGHSEKLLALQPPAAVLREMERISNQYQNDITLYFTFTDGSLYMYPTPRNKHDLQACENYDPRLRYFFTQTKSPEPRDVIVVVDAVLGAHSLVREVVVRTFKALSYSDRIGLCLPHKDMCRTVSFDHQASLGAPKWPGQGPLGRQSFLGQVIVSTERNKDHLSKLLDEWLNSTSSLASPFSSHSAALTAGLHVHQNSSKHPFSQSSNMPHQVLVYVTTRGGWDQWRADPQLSATLNDSFLHNVSIVINPIYEAAVGLEDELLMADEKWTVKLVPFPTSRKFYSSQSSITSFGFTETERAVIPMPYWDAFGAGYIMSVCQPLIARGEFVGTACTDDSIVNLLADTAIDDVEKAYVFIVNSMGNTLMHPLLPSPHSLTEEPYHVTIDKLEKHSLDQNTLEQIVRQQPGSKDVRGVQVQSIGRPRGTTLPHAVRVAYAHLRYLWAPINTTDLTIALVLPLQDGKVMSSVYKCHNSTACQVDDFQYHLSKSDDDRKLCSYFGTEVVKNEGLVKFAPDCFINVLSYVKGEDDKAITQLYSIFQGKSPYDEVLTKDFRASVKLVETAEQIWLEKLNLSDYIGLQFMGTADGTFIVYPGTELKQTYDHRSTSWYLLAMSSLEPGSISMTTPYCDEWGAGMMYTITKPLHGPLGNPVAVVAGDFTLQYIMAYFLRQIPYCKRHTCLLLDQMGYVVLKTDWVRQKTSPHTCANNTDIAAAHINQLAPDIARDMIGSKLLQRRGCHDYERDLTFYFWSLGLSGYSTYYEAATYVVHRIPSTNLFLVVRTKRLTHDTCHCDPYLDEELMECHDTCLLECECPCVARNKTQPCHDPNADVHRKSLPACKPRGLTHVNAKNYTEQQSSLHPPCNDNTCNFHNETVCNSVVLCLWLDNKCRNVDNL
ncbi:VWFA and cache domain-containing protein 1-like isoform X2 [Panulirus ornatus]|uniref:VWFA and cache domain-containing protein 1-like isoform X2 n=1 Tax=Panulirus ornatus TaxID=150431 RepID=UPI003A843C70